MRLHDIKFQTEALNKKKRKKSGCKYGVPKVTETVSWWGVGSGVRKKQCEPMFDEC